jgi:3-dehydroquinate synthase
VDENTAACIGEFSNQLVHLDADFDVLEVPSGEESKSIEVVVQLWASLLEYGADRDALLINLGGGMICDLGAFVASTYKRGMSYVQVPTSLLAMVDASIGGKTGINFQGLKNQIGTFSEPDAIVIAPMFLTSLSKKEWISGHGEMIKHSLLNGSDWPAILQLDASMNIEEEIRRSVQIKSDVVSADFKERGYRKVLNLGHTFGHAWESLMLEKGTPIPHGMAVVQGLHLALALSQQEQLQRELSDKYPWEFVDEKDFKRLWANQLADKKNHSQSVQFVLLDRLGQPTIDNPVDIKRWMDCMLLLNQQVHG